MSHLRIHLDISMSQKVVKYCGDIGETFEKAYFRFYETFTGFSETSVIRQTFSEDFHETVRLI